MRITPNGGAVCSGSASSESSSPHPGRPTLHRVDVRRLAGRHAHFSALYDRLSAQMEQQLQDMAMPPLPPRCRGRTRDSTSRVAAMPMARSTSFESGLSTISSATRSDRIDAHPHDDVDGPACKGARSERSSPVMLATIPAGASGSWGDAMDQLCMDELSDDDGASDQRMREQMRSTELALKTRRKITNGALAGGGLLRPAQREAPIPLQ